MGKVELGLGLIGIGKPWGHVPGDVPAEKEALALLEFAFELGIRHFDTAPSYGGASEERLGKFLRTLNPAERDGLAIATKFGEHWDSERHEPFVDHSFDALRRSLDASLDRLGRIDILQLHKTTPEALVSDGLLRAWEYATARGIPALGASVSDVESARIAIEDDSYAWIQLPFNIENAKFAASIDAATTRGKKLAINRPFAMGAMLHGAEPAIRAAAFAFVLKQNFSGVILTGTKSRAHLAENWAAFQNLRWPGPTGHREESRY